MRFSLGHRFIVVSLLASIASLVSGCSSGTSTTASTPSLTIAATTLPAGVALSAYNASISVSGGTAPYSCSGTATGGLTLNSNCTVTGVPSTPGTSTFTVSAIDSSSPQRSGSASISVTIAPAPPIITTTSLPAGAVGIQYVASIAVSNGTAPFNCTVASGALPAGLSFSGCNIIGTPTTATSFTFTVKVTDSGNPVQTVTSNSLSIMIAATPNIRVLAGNTPIVGASVQIYAAGTGGNGSAPTPLGSAQITSNTGAFALPSVSCPKPTSIVFLVATGGRATSAGVANTGSVLMSSPGACSALATTSNFVINEETTVAAAYAFTQFLNAGAQLGSTATNSLGITLAAGTFANLVNPANGTVPGANFSSLGTAPAGKINLLADAMDACLTAASPSGTACSSFYSAAAVGTVAPTNTLDAILNLAKNPGINTAPLFTLGTAAATPFYSPLPTVAPSDWTMTISYTGGGMNDPTQVAIDSQGRIWVASYFSTASLFNNTGNPVFANGISGNSLLDSYGGAVDLNDNFWVANEEGGPTGIGTVTVLNSSGAAAAGSPYSAGGLNFPISIAVDSTGISWVVDYGNSHVTLLNNNGTPTAASGANGFTTSGFIFPVAIAVDSNRNGYVVNQSSNTVTKFPADGSSFSSYQVGSGPSGVAIDANNNVWTANYYNDSVGLVTSAGMVKSGLGGYVGGGVVHPQGIAVDGAGTVWVTNYRGPSFSELAGANATNPGAPISPAAGWAPDANLLEAFGIAIDASGNIWITNFGNNTLSEFIGMAVPVKTPLIGPPIVP
jgi:hypothetical protein